MAIKKGKKSHIVSDTETASRADISDEDFEEDEPLSTPVKRGRGRPPKKSVEKSEGSESPSKV